MIDGEGRSIDSSRTGAASKRTPRERVALYLFAVLAMWPLFSSLDDGGTTALAQEPDATPARSELQAQRAQDNEAGERPDSAGTASAAAPDTARAPSTSGSFGTEARPSEAPWIVEGDSLWGSRDFGTEILNPHLTHEGLRVRADRGRLGADRQVLILIDAVRIEDSVRVVTAREGIYRRIDRVLDLVGDVRGRGPEGDFTASELTYERISGRIELRGNPEVTDSARVITADRMVLQRDSGVGEAIGQVRILLRADSTYVNGDRAVYDQDTGEMIVTGHPWLYRPGPDSTGDLSVHADTLRMNEFERNGEALGNVLIERSTVRARAGRATFDLARSRTRLVGDPVAWDNDGEIHADTLSIRIQEGRADLLEAFGNVTVDYQPASSPGERNIALGDTLRATVAAGEISDLRLIGNAASLYLPTIGEARRGTGRNVTTARKIDLFLVNGEVERTDFIEGAKGTYHFPSQASLRVLRDPARLDSLTGGAEARAYDELEERFRDLITDPEQRSATDSLPAPRESQPPPPESSEITGEARTLDPIALFFRDARTLDFPESLQTPLDSLFDETVIYEGDTIRFMVDEDRLSLRGRGRMEYQGSELESDEIDYFAQRDLVQATGSPTLRDAGSEVKGQRMTYRTDEREGMVFQGKTEFEGGFYYGEQVKKLSDTALLVKNGAYTTCAEDPPHYSFHSRSMKLLLKDKVVARPVVLHLREIPVFAIPFYFFPLKSGRQSGLLFPDFEFGFNENRGRFVRNLGYYWALSDYMDLKTWVDFYDRGPQLYLNGDFRYKVQYLLNGGVRGSYLNEQLEGGSRRRWSVDGSHIQELGERARLTMDADFKSDATFIDDYDVGAGVDDRLNRQIESSASFSKSWDGASLSLSTTRTQFLDETTGLGRERTENVPWVDLRLNTMPLGREADELGRGGRLSFLSSTYFSPSFRFRRTLTRDFDGTFSDNSAADASIGLSDTRSWGDYLRISPGVRTNLAWFRKDARGATQQVGAVWSGSVSASTTLYGTMANEIGPLAGLRHVVKPNVSYNYQPDFPDLSYRDENGREQRRFPSVGGVSLSGSKVSSMGFSLEQSIHTKWNVGEEVVKKENVLNWSAGSGYNFLAKDPAKPLSDISNTIRFQPFRTFDASYGTTIDPYRWTNQGYNVNANVRVSSQTFAGAGAPKDTTGASQIEYGELGQADLRGTNIGNREQEEGTISPIPWDLNLAYSYSGGGGFERNTLNAGLGFSPSGNWRISSSAYYDLVERDLIQHSFSLYRDLHCWELRFEYSSRGTYYFRVNIKDLQDIKYETQK